MDFFDKFKSLETNPIYGEKEVDIGIYKIYSGKMKCYDADKFGNTIREAKCETCNGTGIAIPESEAK